MELPSERIVDMLVSAVSVRIDTKPEPWTGSSVAVHPGEACTLDSADPVGVGGPVCCKASWHLRAWRRGGNKARKLWAQPARKVQIGRSGLVQAAEQQHLLCQHFVMDLPLITEATNDYYRNIYADPLLGPIFRGVNMVVLRQHVSYFIHQVTMFDAPMTERQLDYLRKVHKPVIARHNISQTHYDLMVGHLVDAMRTNGAQEQHLDIVQTKLQPLRDLFPPPSAATDTPVDASIMLHRGQCPMQHLKVQQQQLHQYAVLEGQASSFDMDSSSLQGSSILYSSSVCTDFDSKEQLPHAGSTAMHPRVKAWARRVLRSLRGKNSE